MLTASQFAGCLARSETSKYNTQLLDLDFVISRVIKVEEWVNPYMYLDLDYYGYHKNWIW